MIPVKIKVVWEQITILFNKLLKNSVSVLLKPKSGIDEALTWIVLTTIIGVGIPFAMIIINILIQAHNNDLVIEIMKNVIDENILLYFSMGIVSAAAVDFYIISIKTGVIIREHESYLSISIQYVIFPTVLFFTVLLMLVASFTGKLESTERLEFAWYVHLMIFSITMLYGFMAKYRCVYLSDSHNLNNPSS